MSQQHVEVKQHEELRRAYPVVMTLSPLARPLSVADRLSDMVAWDAVPPTARVAVIDIGSNSVRLVFMAKTGLIHRRYSMNGQIAGLELILIRLVNWPTTVSPLR